MTEPRQKMKKGPYDDIQDPFLRNHYEAPKVHDQKDEPVHEEGCAICDSAPRDVDETTGLGEVEDLPQAETLGDQASAYAEKRARARAERDDAEKKTNVEDNLVEINAMFKELMTLKRRKFVLKQKLFAFRFAPDTLDKGSTFDLESIAIHRVQLLQEEMDED